jgi:predicted permease
VAGDQPLAAGFTSSIAVVGREAEAVGWPEPSIRRVDAAYFSTMGVPVMAGRAFDMSDGADTNPVILINDTARRRFFEARDPLGQRISLWGQARTIVGVIGDERVHGLATAPPPAVYLPTTQAPIGSGSLLVRAGVPAASLLPSVRSIVRDLDPALALFGVEALDDTLADSMGQQRFTMIVLGAFAAVALLLAVVGVHGVLSYNVAQRTRELGIRLALGAEPGSVARLVVGQGALLIATGLAIGLVGALAVTRGLSSLLYGVGAADPVTYIGVAGLLGAVAIIASWLPARRASKVNPLAALRVE